MGQMDNHAFGNTNQAPVNQATNQAANNSPLKAINSKVFGRGTFEIPFFGAITTGQGILGLLVIGAIVNHKMK